MTEHIGSGVIVKFGIVTHDAAATASALRALFAPGPVPASQSETPAPSSAPPSKTFRGRPCGSTPLKVVNVYTDNFWFEVVQPLDDSPSPWRSHLDAHGVSACFFSVHISGGLDHDAGLIESLGFPEIFREEKGHERYAYFDTVPTLGLLLEVKERLPA
ncbi:MAG: hypothetical protein LBK95_13930 [Bifidobacteriaceae bacterium]|jgi:hypothetical protein|nr:hypothetical protein [Bifidobacteriaceae bacterium]